MKYLKMLGIAAVAAMSFMAFAASSASATTLEVGGVTQNGAVTITGSLDESVILARTDGSFANTCTKSHFHGTTTKFTKPVTGPLSSLTFEGCERPVTVHKPGALEVVHIAGTTNGTVFSESAEVTSGSPFGTLNCKTGETTHIGTLTAATTATNPTVHATVDVNAVLNCGFLVPSATWKGSYWITSPTELGVSA
ncbi:MAG TPA: hypothetical protein VFZ29_00890 [Solirubrobacterales bacterium]